MIYQLNKVKSVRINLNNYNLMRPIHMITAEVEPKKPNALKRYVFHGINSPTGVQFQLELFNQAPNIEEGEILARVRAATICLSDIHTICGARKEPLPSVLGHEGCVEIVESRRSCRELKVGDRITFSIADSCGRCEFCLNNMSQKCENLFKYGHASTKNGSGFNGCYASHILIRAGTHVIKLPNEIKDDLAATINCALATMVNCVDNIPKRIKENKSSLVLIQGDGMLGLYGCALLKELNIRRIYCSGNKTIRSDLIKGFGAIPISDEIEELSSQRNKFDCIIEACGNSDAFLSGINLLKSGGVYMLVGMVHPCTNLSLTGEHIIRKCLTLKGIHNYHWKHLEQAVEFLHRTIGKYPYDYTLAPKRFSLEQLPNAIDYAKRKEFPRVCIRP